MNRSRAHDRLDGVRAELRAAAFCIGRTLAQVRVDATVLHDSPHEIRPADVVGCGVNVEVTYLIRLFAEFEEVCRDYWAATRPGSAGQRRRTQMEVLMDRVAALCDVPQAVLAKAHAVRAYRNDVLHARERAGRHSFDECRSWLASFVSFLPVRW